jgi:hypothetical protein
MSRSNQDEVFKIYQLAVEMADRHSSRRTTSNSFFLTLQSALIAGVGLFIKSQDSFTNSTYFSMLVLAFLGIVLCVSWVLTIKSYKDLSSAKWGVILETEKSLPTKPFTDEWKLLETDNYLQWKNDMSGYKRPKRLFKWLRERHKYYTPQSSVERYIPSVLIVGYIIIVIVAIVGLVVK